MKHASKGFDSVATVRTRWESQLCPLEPHCANDMRKEPSLPLVEAPPYRWRFSEVAYRLPTTRRVAAGTLVNATSAGP